MNRVLEPELMTDPDQAQAYAAADFATVNQGFVDRLRALFPALTRGHVVDLGCGPADIPIRLCRALPDVAVTGVDGSEAMLAPGRRGGRGRAHRADPAPVRAPARRGAAGPRLRRGPLQ
jgi:trans-aconitate methyltransferase